MGILDYIPEQHQTIRNYGNFFPMQQPQNGTDMVNGSFAEEAVKENQKHQQNLIDAAREEAIRQDPEILNHVQREIAKGLLGNKIAYQAAEGAGNIPGMTQAQMAADSLRKQGESIGWDGRGYGADVSLQDAAQNLANNDTMAINKLFYNTQTPNAYYNQQYDHLREIGVSRKRAEEEATRRTDVYLEQTANNMLDAFHTYGTDDSGVINPNGLRILSMMGMGGNSEIANFLAKMNPSPVQGWNYGNSLRAAEMADKNKRDYMGLQYGYQQAGQDAAQRRARENAQWTADFNDARNIQAMQQRAAMADGLGLSDEDRMSYILTGRLSSGRAGNGKSGVNGASDKELKKQQDVAAKVNPVLMDFMQGNMGVDDYLQEISKYTPYLDENDSHTLTNDIVYTRNFLNEYQRDRDNENTLKYYKAIRDDEECMSFVPPEAKAYMEERLKKQGE